MPYLMICPIFERDPHHYRKTQADLAALELINLLLLAMIFFLYHIGTYIVDLNLP